MAIGSAKGEIRLFSRDTLTKKTDPLARVNGAKTNLPGMGDPILGIDATEDADWILATCKNYLLLIPTQFSKANKVTNGFKAPMGKNKPVPRRLQLSPEDVRKMGGNVSFTPAKFNIGMDKERSIVTSSGPFIITWNFRKVKQNKLGEYKIKRYNDTVVADQFKFGEDQSIVVCMSDDVTVARRLVKY